MDEFERLRIREAVAHHRLMMAPERAPDNDLADACLLASAREAVARSRELLAKPRSWFT